MINRVQIKQKIPLECKYLDKNINDHMLKILKTRMNGYCNFTHGYIIDVIKIISLGENTISSANSLTVFNVIYEADILKPIVGSILTGDVCMVLQNGDGIMVDICNKMQVLIPASYMKPFVYKIDSLSFELKKKCKERLNSISNGTKIEIVIVASKYEKKNYSCIGKIII